jgi:hypothetical protein
MLGGIVMMAVSGMLLMWWLIANTGSGFVGLFWILGILTGIGVFAGGAAEAVRASHEPTVRARS